MEYDSDGLEAVSYMMQHDGRPHPEPPPPGVTPQVKAIICKAINDCNGDMDCVFRGLNRDRKNRRYPGGPIDPKKWNDPDLRDAENFATAAASNSYGIYGLPGYPWVAHSEWGIFEYQYLVKPFGSAIGRRSTPVSDAAYSAGVAGLDLYQKGPSAAQQWCHDCTK
jgi:hypothetical protein